MGYYKLIWVFYQGASLSERLSMFLMWSYCIEISNENIRYVVNGCQVHGTYIAADNIRSVMSAIIVWAQFPRFLPPLRGNVLSKARARQWRPRDTQREWIAAIVQLVAVLYATDVPLMVQMHW